MFALAITGPWTHKRTPDQSIISKRHVCSGGLTDHKRLSYNTESVVNSKLRRGSPGQDQTGRIQKGMTSHIAGGSHQEYQPFCSFAHDVRSFHADGPQTLRPLYYGPMSSIR